MKKEKFNKELMGGIIALKTYAPDGVFYPDHGDLLEQDFERSAKKEKIFNKIKDIITTIFSVLCAPFFLLYFFGKIIKDVILYCLRHKSIPSRTEFYSIVGGNTEYKIECPDCGHSEKVMIGGSHTSGSNGRFSTELVYCRTCKEPLEKTSVHYNNKEDGEDRISNEKCPNCGRKTIPYKVWQNKIKLKCPKCGCQNLEITDLHSFWMT